MSWVVAGIFVLPAIIAENMGESGVLAYLFCWLLFGLIMLCFAEAGSKVVHSGGSYAYVKTAFGAYPEFLVSMFFTDYFGGYHSFFPVLNGGNGD